MSAAEDLSIFECDTVFDPGEATEKTWFGCVGPIVVDRHSRYRVTWRRKFRIECKFTRTGPACDVVCRMLWNTFPHVSEWTADVHGSGCVTVDDRLTIPHATPNGPLGTVETCGYLRPSYTRHFAAIEGTAIRFARVRWPRGYALYRGGFRR